MEERKIMEQSKNNNLKRLIMDQVQKGTQKILRGIAIVGSASVW